MRMLLHSDEEKKKITKQKRKRIEEFPLNMSMELQKMRYERRSQEASGETEDGRKLKRNILP